MFPDALAILGTGRARRVGWTLAGSLALGLCAGAASVGLLALSGWFIAMSALAGVGLAAGFSFFYPSAGVQALAFGRTALRYGERLLGHDSSLRLDASLKEALFTAVVESPEVAGGQGGTGALLHTVTNDAEVVETSLLRIVAPVGTFVGVLVGGSVLIATVDLQLAGVIVIGAMTVAICAVMAGWITSMRSGRRLAADESQTRQEIVDALDGLDELEAFGGQALAGARVERSLRGIGRTQSRLRSLSGATRALATALAGATVLVVAALASGAIGTRPVAVATAAAITLGALGMLQLTDPLAVAARDIGRTRAVWARLNRTLATPPTRVGARRNGREGRKGVIQVEDVRIDRGRGTITDHLSFTALPGDTVLLTGRSGSGKSSLVAVLAGTIDVSGGLVSTGGKVVWLPQHPYVFAGTVADNLRIADPDASEERMVEILTLVGLDQVLGTSPLEERVGAGGRTLSGGQVRRLGFARAMLARPDILLADEPTEGLDQDAAGALLVALRLSNPWMTLVLALHDQQLRQLSWAPDTVIRHHTGSVYADVVPEVER
jgi:ATP-binding cassette subfamily C protein CydC